jgi:hypothetical protein
MSGIKYTYPKIYDGRKNKLYRGSKDCKNMIWHKGIKNEGNQKIQHAKRIQDIMI